MFFSFYMYQGVKIQATCNQSLLQKFEKQCVVGEWKFIANFTLSSAVGLIRRTNHAYNMHFVSQTSIIDCKVACPNMYLDLDDFVNISNGSYDPRYLIGNICFFLYIFYIY